MQTTQRPGAHQPLRAHWDPTSVDEGRQRSDRRTPRRTQSAVGRFISVYGWRAYAIPVLVILTVALILSSLLNGDSQPPSKAAVATPVDTTDPSLKTQKSAVGAPTVTAAPRASVTGALPDGPPYTKTGQRVYSVVPGTSPRVGAAGAKLFTYTVEFEQGLQPSDFGGVASFAKMVENTLANKKSWIGDGKVAFQRIDKGTPDFRVSLSSTDTTKELCGYQIKLESSCYYPPDLRVTLNEARWVRGALSYSGDDIAYRQYMLNHEIGHAIGHAKHQPCLQQGALAPIMMQQTFGTANTDIIELDLDMSNVDPKLVCRPNPWPFPTN